MRLLHVDINSAVRWYELNESPVPPCPDYNMIASRNYKILRIDISVRINQTLCESASTL